MPPTTFIPKLRLHLRSGQRVLSTSPDELFSIIGRMSTVPSYAKRVRELDIDFLNESSNITDDIGLRLGAAFGSLEKLTSLTLGGCFSSNYHLLDGPPHLPHLKTLSCDFSFSPEFEKFLVANPTIDTLYFGGDDIYGNLDVDEILARDALPNLNRIECDISFLRYFVTDRPLLTVMPMPIDSMTTEEDQIFSMASSTANGGIAAGGGVEEFQLAFNYPLTDLAGAVPNLKHLYLTEKYGTRDPSVPPAPFAHLHPPMPTQACFWNTPGWENGLAYLQRLQELTVDSAEKIPHIQQMTLVTLWAAHCTLARVTFKYRNVVRVTFSDVLPAPESAIWTRNNEFGSWDVRVGPRDTAS